MAGRRADRPAWRRALGPGLVTGAADDDPSGIATHSQAGAQFGYGFLWSAFLTTPFMIAIQSISARIGWATGRGLAANLAAISPRPASLAMVALLVAANTLNIAADIAAMGEALQLAAGGSRQLYALAFGLTSLALQIFVPYHRYASYLKFLTLAVFVYVAAAFTVAVPWGEVAAATLAPRIELTRETALMITAVFGTTISPYMFFWQAAQEVEERDLHHAEEPRRLTQAFLQANVDRIRLDTTIGMIVSNVIAFFIMVTTATTLHRAGVTEIQTASQAAEALRPLAGPLTFALFSAGVIGTGLLAVPVLAGSAAYAVAEVAGWRSSLEARPQEAKGFYLIVGVATLAGVLAGFGPVPPFRLLFWAAVINGVVSVPIMIGMMRVVTSRRIMGRLVLAPAQALLGWLATALMALASLALLASLAR